ncbi:uncharacterized protein Z520_07533 [Fonsecaea multimorphosa CBS 102226]|uniref:Ysc84 actin-binding domain-containing protein n=1 Tax=Fonsecaea multimorphosa CBS 102226 TaxID=1442371 RepID=A0A0D2KJR3_9EURO|nr:uncharacterized protein Z520_07533 [Fonsecaea multimorphosa CBS 102226]KIX96813.1 hypothetical protein Z520_07533 [Fonsecaea multimorphosa CBS 102226]OAL22493.1 hypothetical protein AYO22_07051 [Fonsecaea multimorphosa]
MTGSLKKECDKAAQILKSFIDKGRIPAQVITTAKGIAIFSGFRAAMYLAGAGGSGVVVARLADGSWSAPSAFSVRSGGIGVVYGVDVYDCVCVLNTQDAVEAYMKSDMTMGAGASMAAGPIGGTADLSTKDVKPIWTYTKSRGLYGGLTVDGTVIKEKSSINAESYGKGVAAAQILAGGAEWPGQTQLREVLKMAEGKSADATVLGAISTDPTPGDLTQ